MSTLKVGSDEIHFDDLTGPTASALVIVWGHGFLLSAKFYTNVISHLPGHRHVIVDHRGHGRSNAAATEGTLQRMADDIWAVVDSLGITQFAYVGHSMGNAIGWRLTASHPEAVLAGVSIAGIPVNGKLPEARQWVRSMIDMAGDADALTEMIAVLYKHPEPTPDDARAAGVAAALVPQGIISEIVSDQFHLDESITLLPALTQPWLFIVPAEDDSEPAHYQVSQAALLPDSHSVMLEGEGHMVPQERPELVARHIEAFLGRLDLR